MNHRRHDSLCLHRAPSVPGVCIAHVRWLIVFLSVALPFGPDCRGQFAPCEHSRSVPPGYSDPWRSYRSLADVPIGHARQLSLRTTVSLRGSVASDAHFSPGSACGNPQGCASCEPDDCCVPCGRSFALTVRPGFSWRSRSKSQLLLSAPTGVGQTDASQFDFSPVSTVDLAAIWYGSPGDRLVSMDLEVRASLTDRWSDAVTQSFTGNVVQISAVPPLSTTGPRTGTSAYRSDVGSWEINARHRAGQGVTWVTGFRTFRVDEFLSSRLVDDQSAVPDERVQSSVRNRCYGWQVGADYVWRHRCWCLSINGRAGVYSNRGQHIGQLISLAATPVAFPAAGGDNTLAFHAELNLAARWKLAESTRLVLGYRVQWLEGLALAAEQWGNTSFLSRSGYHHNGSLLVNSLSAGVEFWF